MNIEAQICNSAIAAVKRIIWAGDSYPNVATTKDEK
jgi:hypothetical protein